MVNSKAGGWEYSVHENKVKQHLQARHPSWITGPSVGSDKFVTHLRRPRSKFKPKEFPLSVRGVVVVVWGVGCGERWREGEIEGGREFENREWPSHRENKCESLFPPCLA